MGGVCGWFGLWVLLWPVGVGGGRMTVIVITKCLHFLILVRWFESIAFNKCRLKLGLVADFCELICGHVVDQNSLWFGDFDVYFGWLYRAELMPGGPTVRSEHVVVVVW